MKPRQQSVAAVIWLGVVALLAVSLLLAPIIQSGWCADAPASGTSICYSSQKSLVGIDTNVWVWLVAAVIVVLATIVLADRRRRDLK